MHKVALGTVALAFAIFSVPAAHAAGMKLTSAEISNGATIRNEQVFNSFGCTGQNISPSLSWTGAPKGTKSFAISIYDPDAPTGSGWWHWVVFNIPASTTSIPKNAGDLKAKLMPEGAIQSRTDFGAPVMAARVRRKATNRIITTSACLRSMKTSCSSPRMKTLRRRWSVLNCTSTRSVKRDSGRPLQPAGR